MVLSIIRLSPGSVTTATGRGQVTEIKVLEGGDDWQCASVEEREGVRNEFHIILLNSAILVTTGALYTCNDTPGWRSDAFINMTDTSYNCPTGDIVFQEDMWTITHNWWRMFLQPHSVLEVYHTAVFVEGSGLWGYQSGQLLWAYSYTVRVRSCTCIMCFFFAWMTVTVLLLITKSISTRFALLCTCQWLVFAFEMITELRKNM